MINNSNNHRHRSYCSSCKKSQFPTTAVGFLDHCFLCRQKLLPGKDIFMYEGDKGFCSEECRCRQIFMDEEQSMLNAGNRSFATAVNPKTTASPPSAPSSDPKPTGNQAC